jgi:hypothetical protein
MRVTVKLPPMAYSAKSNIWGELCISDFGGSDQNVYDNCDAS